MSFLKGIKQRKPRLYRALALGTALIALAAAAVLICRYRLFFVASASMEPEYRVNSLVVIEKTSFKNVKPGDIIAFESAAINGKLAFHRVIQKTADGCLITKGDNSAVADGEPVTEQNYYGKAVGHTAFLADVIEVVGSPRGQALVICLIFTAAALLFAYPALKPIRIYEKNL